MPPIATISSREAQLQFGSFSREAQREAVIVTSHGNPIFLTLPIKLTANALRLIQEVNPATTEETADRLEGFFARLAQAHPNPPEMNEADLARFIKE